MSIICRIFVNNAAFCLDCPTCGTTIFCETIASTVRIDRYCAVLMRISAKMSHIQSLCRVCNPHELSVVIDFPFIPHLFQHIIGNSLIIHHLIGKLIVIRIIIALFEFVSIAGRIRVVMGISSCNIGQVRSDIHIQLSIVFKRHSCDRMILKSEIRLFCAVVHIESHSAEHFCFVSYNIDCVIFFYFGNCTGSKIITQNTVGNIEIQLFSIQDRSGMDCRIYGLFFHKVCIQFRQHLVCFHFACFRIINRYRITGIEVDQCLIIGIAVAEIRVCYFMTHNLIDRVFKLHILVISLAVVILSQHLQQIGGIIHVINVFAVRIYVADNTGHPAALVIAACVILIHYSAVAVCIQRLDLGIISIKHLCERRMADHEVCMVHVTVCLHTVTIHNL